MSDLSWNEWIKKVIEEEEKKIKLKRKVSSKDFSIHMNNKKATKYFKFQVTHQFSFSLIFPYFFISR